MTVKTETNFWKSLKKLLDSGEGYCYSRIESYSTPGFPDCIIFHNVTGFFTIELKVATSSNKIQISTFQRAWNTIYSIHGAPVFILVKLLGTRSVKLFEGAKAQELSQKTLDAVTGIYEGRLEDLDLCTVVRANSQTPP